MVYAVHKYKNFPEQNPKKDSIIQRFDYWTDARDFALEYNTEKITTAEGKIARFRSNTKDFNGKVMTYKYVHNGNDGYYVNIEAL